MCLPDTEQYFPFAHDHIRTVGKLSRAIFPLYSNKRMRQRQGNNFFQNIDM